MTYAKSVKIMPVYVDHTNRLTVKERITTSLIAGGLAGALAKTVIAPLDRAKINFQVSQSRFSYKALFGFINASVRTSGLRSLWRGNSANMIRVIPSAAINFTAHEQWKRLLQVDTNQTSTPFKRWLAGSLAGMTAAACTYPADLARARMAVTNKAQFSNIIQIFVNTYKTDGVKGLYRGFAPTFLGAIPYAGFGFFTYETMKRFHKKIYSEDPNPLYRMMYGAMAGAAGQTSSYPLDVVRRRMQTASIVNPHEIHLRPHEIFFKILRNEGLIKGLYKGLSMNWIKGPIAASIGFMTYDMLQMFVRATYVNLFFYNNRNK